MANILHSIILGEGEPLLILHGYFGMGDNWKTLGKKFAENYQIHLIDQRNHGRSFHSDEFNYKVMVEDLFNYINHYGLVKVNILGHSMGGKTAMFFAIKHPEMMNKLLIADIGPKYYPPHHETILSALNSVDFSTIGSRGDVDLIFQKFIPEIGVRQFLLKNVYRKTRDSFDYRFNLRSLAMNNDEIGLGLDSNDQFLGKTLFLKGGNSEYISKDDEAFISFHFPDNDIVTISGAGHWLHAESPLEFYQNVVEFLENV